MDNKGYEKSYRIPQNCTKTPIEMFRCPSLLTFDHLLGLIPTIKIVLPLNWFHAFAPAHEPITYKP